MAAKICATFRVRLPDQLIAIQNALRDGDAPRLREAAHKLSGMAAAFSTVAGGLSSELEDHAAEGRLKEAQVLVSQLKWMTEELMRLVGGVSIDTLRDQVQRIAETDRNIDR